MRPTEITNAEIIAAGETLLAAGRNVTGFSLRKLTGGGNPSRLKQVWEEHLAASAKPAEPVAELPVEVADEVAKVTAELVERLSRLAVELNDKAVKGAERRVAEVVRAAGEQRHQAERELADASTTVDELEEGLDLAHSEIERLKKELAESHVRQQAQAVDLAKADQQLADERARTEQMTKELADAKRNELDGAKLQGRLDAITEQNADLLARLEGGKPRK